MIEKDKHALPSRLGVKLPPTNALDYEWDKLLAPFDEPMQYLADVGVDYVEYAVGSLEEREEAEIILEAASTCATLGIGVAIHPYLSGKFNPANYSQGSPCHKALQRALTLADQVSDVTGTVSPVVFHPAAAPYDISTDLEKMRQRLLDRSRAFAAELDRLVAERHPELLAVLEHQVPPNPDEKLIRIADTYEGLLQVVRNSNTPLCWDTGHYLLGVERHGQNLYPPPKFLEKVQHVHLHAVIDGSDHRPVVTESEVLAQYLKSLWQKGFRNGITLEYSLEGLEAEGGLQTAVQQSINLLERWSEQATGPQSP